MAKTTAKKKRPVAKSTTRRVKAPEYKSFRLHKTIKHPKPKVLGSFRIFKLSLSILVKNWKLFGGILLVYLILDIILVKGFSTGNNITELKSVFEALFAGGTAKLATSVALFGFLLGSAGNTTSQQAAAYQSMLLIIMSLVVIWALRQTLAKEKISVKDAFYKSIYPLIPFLLVLLVIGLQLIPLVVSNFLYGIVFGNGLAVSVLEKVLWGAMLFLLALLSIYMVSSSIFALYIVTLPDMKPMQALRSARELVRYRRWTIMRKVLFLPFILLATAALIVIPVLLFLTPIAEWLFFVLTMLALPVIHAYVYSLYREML